MAATASLSLVLHAHLPFVRHPEEPDFLEEDWLYEAVIETYLPLLASWTALAEQGVPFRLGLSISPPLASMLNDPLLMDRASARLGALVDLAERLERSQRGTPFAAATAEAAASLRARWCLFDLRWGRRLLPAFARLAAAGRLELFTTAATHGVLPLMATEEGRHAQLAAGRASHARHFGAEPAGLWLPECAYAPGLHPTLAAAGVRYTVLESHGLLNAAPPPRYGTARPLRSPSGVAFFGRDGDSSAAVWSASQGYPGNPLYREFYRDVGFDLPYAQVLPFLHRDGRRRSVGLKLHRITGSVDLGDKAPYDPRAAAAQAAADGEHFVHQRLRQGQRFREVLGLKPMMLAPYDAELFGHWWSEGPAFLEAALRALAREPALDLRSPSDLLEEFPYGEIGEPALSSWGEGGYFSVWLNPKNDWIYRHLHAAEERMVALAARPAGTDPLLTRALNQAGRELLLAQSSDWAFILTMQTAAAYAERRTREHLVRFHALADQIEAGAVDAEGLAALEARDNLLPELDGRLWRGAGSSAS